MLRTNPSCGCGPVRMDQKCWDGEGLIGCVGKIGGPGFSQSGLALAMVKYITSAVSDASFIPLQVNTSSKCPLSSEGGLPERADVDVWAI